MLLNCGVGEDSWESLGLQGDPASPSWRRSVLGVHWKDWCWSWNSSTLATSCEELTHWKRPWCWEGLRAGGEGDDRGWDGWMASPTRWTWVWVNSGSWWWTGRPGVLRFMGSQSQTRLSDWTELIEKERRAFAFPELHLSVCILDISCEWVANSTSRGSSWPRDRTHISCITGRFFNARATFDLFLSLNGDSLKSPGVEAAFWLQNAKVMWFWNQLQAQKFSILLLPGMAKAAAAFEGQFCIITLRGSGRPTRTWSPGFEHFCLKSWHWFPLSTTVLWLVKTVTNVIHLMNVS